jgi:photosystem II stability/assembly factor-like uncharacterized protein
VGGFLYHTSDGGSTWQEVDIGQTSETGVHSILIDQADGDTVYVGLADVYNRMIRPGIDTYLLKTADGGRSWTKLRLPRTDSTVLLVGRNSGDGTIYAGSGGNLFKSADGGRNWTDISPAHSGADGAEDMAVSPLADNVLLLPTLSYGGILMSTDEGRSWRPSNEGLHNTVVPLLAVPNVPGSGTVYAHAAPGVTFRTMDYGNTWVSVAEHGLTHPWTDELVVSPHDPQTVWTVGDVPRVFKTTNSGDSWTEILGPSRPSSFRFSSIYALATAPSDPGRIYASKNGFGIFKSADRGESWEYLRESEVDYTYSIAVDPTNPDVLYSGYLPKPFEKFAMVRRSLDGGDSWETVLHVPDSRGITSVTIDPLEPNIVYAGSIGERGQIYRSLDGADSWSRLNEQFIMCTVWGQPQLILDPANPSTTYAATWLAGTWKTTDAGATWELLEQAPVSSTALSLDARDSHVIYCADRTQPAIWKSTDAGATWERIADFSSHRAFLVNRVLADGGTVYASTFGPTMHDGRLYKSTDSGAAWTDVTGDLPRSVLDVAVDPMHPDIVYVTTHIHGAYKSTDGGATWAPLEDFPDIGAYDIEVDSVDSTTVYACGLGNCSVPSWCMQPDGYTFADDAGVYKSEDSGRTPPWMTACRSARTAAIAGWATMQVCARAY